MSGSRAGLNIKLTVGDSGLREWTVGSQADREVQFQDSGVSALHAKIVNEGERWKVLDQMSANGTFVNGKRSNVSYLSTGDRVRFGPVECVFQTSRAAAAPRRRGGSPAAESARNQDARDRRDRVRRHDRRAVPRLQVRALNRALGATYESGFFAFARAFAGFLGAAASSASAAAAAGSGGVHSRAASAWRQALHVRRPR